jgi:hypothetical protein
MSGTALVDEATNILLNHPALIWDEKNRCMAASALTAPEPDNKAK